MYPSKSKLILGKIACLFFLFACLSSCTNSSQTVPFPIEETEFEQPKTTFLKNVQEAGIFPKKISFKGKFVPQRLKAQSSFQLPKNEFAVSDLIKYPLKPASVIRCLFNDNLNCNPKKVLLGQAQIVIAKNPQSTDDATKNIKFYSQDQGLIATIAHCLTYDRDGRLWIGTDGGLCMFDGHQWSIYTTKEGLSNNYISSVLAASDGRIFAGTDGGGLNILDFKQKLIKRYTTSTGLSNGYIISLCENKDGRIFIGTDGGGLNILDEEKKVITQIYSGQQKTHNYIHSILFENNKIYLGTNGAGLSVYDEEKEQFTNYSVDEGLSDNSIEAIQGDGKGNIYVATNGGGLDILNLKNNTISHFTTQNGLSGNEISSIYFCKNGDLLIGTKANGFNILNLNSNTIKHYSESEGINNVHIMCALEASDGKILIGTYGGGLNILEDKHTSITHYTRKEGLSNNYVKSLAETADGEICIGTYGAGLNVLNDATFSYYSKEQGLSGNEIYCIIPSKDGKIYLGTSDGGVNILDRSKQTITKLGMDEGLESDHVNSICFNKDGKLMVGSYGGGLSVVDLENQTMENCTAKEGLGHNYIRDVIETKDGKWVLSTDGAGLNIIDPKNQKIRYITTQNGLSNDVIFSMIENRKGQLMLGTYGGGLNIIDLKKNTITKFTTKEGFPNDLVLSLIEDEQGIVWVGTGKGLVKLVPINEGYKIEKIFSKDEGLKFVDFNTNSVMLSKTGHLWFGIGDVLTKFHQKSHNDSTSPPVYISAIDISDEQVDWKDVNSILNRTYSTFNGQEIVNDTIWSTSLDTFYITKRSRIQKDFFRENGISFKSISGTYQLPSELVLPYRKNHITFHYTGIHIGADADQIRYRYILEGADDKWSPITDKMEADYRNIPPGDYTFKIAARSVNGYWGQPQEFKFTVLSPWYQTLWFRCIAVIMIFVGVWYFIRWREQSLKQRQRELQNLVDERTEEVVIQKQEIEAQQKEMIDSIIYAKRVQNAILPSEVFIKKYLPESFLLYKPKDIVAGDFYWMEPISAKAQSDGKGEFLPVTNHQLFLAAGDCTGHGVPGAMVSVVCSNALNRALNEFEMRDTGEILDTTREIVLDTFAKSGEDINDGMDISLLKIELDGKDKSTFKIEWSGANNSLKYIEDNKLKEIKADKQPIGRTYDPKPFTTHQLVLKKGDMLFLMTDGFADQFGGPKGKKFKRKQFDELLLQNIKLSMKDLCTVLDDSFEDWRGYLEQVDDVCIIGIRL